jgi:UDP-N-acetylmuramate--alanine ligase
MSVSVVSSNSASLPPSNSVSSPPKTMGETSSAASACGRPVLNPSLTLNKEQPIHFVGVGGVGMSGLARILLSKGFQVSGSDLKENAYVKELSKLGATIHIGEHQPAFVPAGALVVVTTAVRKDNPELVAAQQQGLTIVHRSDVLRCVLHQPGIGVDVSIGVTGTHGKTTITGMMALALEHAEFSPMVIAGGRLSGATSNVMEGAPVSGQNNRRYAVAELDESDGTLLQYTPTVTILPNIELDHAEHFPEGLSGIQHLFESYINQLATASLKEPPVVVANQDCPLTAALLAKAPSSVKVIRVSCGNLEEETSISTFQPDAEYWLQDVCLTQSGDYTATVYHHSQGALGQLSVNVPGRHNLSNALLVLVAGLSVGAPLDLLLEGVALFTGMGRRFEVMGPFPELPGVLTIDDYGHHPTEVIATLRAARQRLKSFSRVENTQGRLLLIFQPHRYTRLHMLWQDFLTCFQDADELWLVDVYAAHEDVIPGVTSEAFTFALQTTNTSGKQVIASVGGPEQFDALRTRIAAWAKPGDMVVSMGAGDITNVFRRWPVPSITP